MNCNQFFCVINGEFILLDYIAISSCGSLEPTVFHFKINCGKWRLGQVPLCFSFKNAFMMMMIHTDFFSNIIKALCLAGRISSCVDCSSMQVGRNIIFCFQNKCSSHLLWLLKRSREYSHLPKRLRSKTIAQAGTPNPPIYHAEYQLYNAKMSKAII